MSVLFMNLSPATDSNTLAAVKRANEWFKCAANNMLSGVNALKAHGIDHEQAGSLLDELSAMIHGTNQAILNHNKEVSGAGSNKTSGKVVRTERPGDGCEE